MRDMGRLFRRSSGIAVVALALPALAAAPAPQAPAPAPVQLQPAQQLSSAAPAQLQAPPAEINARLASAVGTGTPQEVEPLLKSGGNPNASDSRGVPLLSLAALRTDASAQGVMRTLLAAGADINIRDQYQQTPL